MASDSDESSHLYDVISETISGKKDKEESADSLANLRKLKRIQQDRRVNELVDATADLELLKMARTVREEKEKLEDLIPEEEDGKRPAKEKPAEPAMPAVTLAEAEALANMTPEKRDMVMSVYQALNLATNPKANQLLPLMMMFANRPSPTTQMDLQGFSETMLKWMDKGMQLTTPKEGGGMTLQDKLVDKLLDVALNKQPAVPATERQTLKDEIATLKELKELFPESAAPPQLPPSGPPIDQSMEMAKAKGEQDVKKLDLILAHNRELIKIGNEGKRYELLKDGAATIAQAAGYALGGGEMAGLEQQSQAPKPSGATVGKSDLTWEATCDWCKTAFPIPDPNTLPADVLMNCPKCGRPITLPGSKYAIPQGEHGPPSPENQDKSSPPPT